MVGGAGLHYWLTLFVVVSSAKDSMHARFHMWGVCGHAWCHLCHPLATRAGPAKPRMGSQKSKQKSPRMVSRHPPVYLSHTSNFHNNHCLGTRLRCVFAFCTSDCSGRQPPKESSLVRTKSERLFDKKTRYFCDATLQSGHWWGGAIVTEEREVRVINFSFYFGS